MKYLGQRGLTLLLVLGLTSPSWAAYPDVTYDMWIDFESLIDATTVTPTTLANSTRGAAGTWTVSGTLNKGATNREDPHTVTTTDPGIIGMSNDPTTTGSYADWALPASKTTVSIGLWFKTASYAAFAGGPTVVKIYNAGTGSLVRLTDEKNAGDNSRYLRLVEGGSGVTVADDTWYWVTMKYTKNSTVSLGVYTTSLGLVGSATYTDAINVNVDAFRLGNDGSSVAPAGGETVGFDDFIVDYTSAVYPLLPGTMSAPTQSGGFMMGLFQ